MKNDPNMIHPSAKACCDNLFPNANCQVNKICETGEVASAPSSPSISQTTSSAEAPCGAWHVSTIGDRDTCTNDMEYPDAWNMPELAGKQLFDTAQACCDAIHAGKDVCHKTNVCPSGITGTRNPTKKPTHNPTETLVSI